MVLVQYLSVKFRILFRKYYQTQMKPNRSAVVSPNLNKSLSVKQLASPSNKKTEGFDKTTFSSTFTSKIDKLKKKPKTDALQEQYVNGLQDEIKYLQMELKLLQEKDMQKHSQIDQLEKFFGDGIPINENILAIKNGFNNYKTNHKKKLEEIVGEKDERSGLIKSLTQRVETLAEQLQGKEKDSRGLEVKNSQKLFQLVSRQAALKKIIELEEEQLKTVKLQNRRVFQTIQKINRTRLIDNITLIKSQNQKNSQLTILKDSIVQKQKQLLEAEKQLGDLQRVQANKVYLIRLEEENLAQKKRTIALERELDNNRSKIKEKEIELSQKLRQRMVEINAKLLIKNKVQDLKTAIDKANGLSVEQVQQYARQKEVQAIKRVIDYNKKLAKYTDHYSKILSQTQANIQTMAQRKPQLKSQIQSQRQQVSRLRTRLAQQKQRQVNIHAQMTRIDQQYTYCTSKLVPMQERLKKTNDKITSYTAQQQRLLEQIQLKGKQLQLIFILKELNFEETEISKVSNSNLQGELVSFMKSWEKIQRST